MNRMSQPFKDMKRTLAVRDQILQGIQSSGLCCNTARRDRDCTPEGLRRNIGRRFGFDLSGMEA